MYEVMLRESPSHGPIEDFLASLYFSLGRRRLDTRRFEEKVKKYFFTHISSSNHAWNEAEGIDFCWIISTENVAVDVVVV